MDESSLAGSVNAEIPGDIIQPGLEMVIEVDPDGTLDPELFVAKRIPETGRLAVEVHTMALFDLVLIPFVSTQTHDSSRVELVRAIAADPKNHKTLRPTRTLLPIGDIRVTAHAPVLSSSTDAHSLYIETGAIQAMESSDSTRADTTWASCPRVILEILPEWPGAGRQACRQPVRTRWRMNSATT